MKHDGEQLTEFLAPLVLPWKARTQKELALMADLGATAKETRGRSGDFRAESV